MQTRKAQFVSGLPDKVARPERKLEDAIAALGEAVDNRRKRERFEQIRRVEGTKAAQEAA